MSGPARGRFAPAVKPRADVTLGARALTAVRSLPDVALLDRIVRGRAWIPLLGVLLAGIVFTQVEILKLGTSMGRWIQQSSALASRNQALQANVAALMDDQRIEQLAAGMGMVMPAPTAVGFLAANPGSDAARAIANVHAPDPTGFVAQLPAQGTSTASSAGTTGATSATVMTGATSSGGTTSASGTPPSSSTQAASSSAPASSAPASTGAATGQSAASGPSTGGAAMPIALPQTSGRGG